MEKFLKSLIWNDFCCFLFCFSCNFYMVRCFLALFDFVCLVVCFRFVKDNQEFKRGLLNCSFQHFCFNFCKGSELSAYSSGSEVLLDMTFKSFIHHSTDHLILPKLSRVQTFRHLSNPLGLACVQPSPPLKKNLEEFLGFPMFFRGWRGCTQASWVSLKPQRSLDFLHLKDRSASHYAKPTGQRSVEIPNNNGSYHFLFLFRIP